MESVIAVIRFRQGLAWWRISGIIVVNAMVTYLLLHRFDFTLTGQTVYDSSQIYPDMRKSPHSDPQSDYFFYEPIIELGRPKSTLPGFTHDRGDYILGSIIELSFDSFGPFLTTFFLDHHAMFPFLADKMGVIAVDPSHEDDWKEFSRIVLERDYNGDIVYELSGKRVSRFEYTCRVAHSTHDRPYVVTGYFLPNRLALNVNANRRLNILRCPIRDGVNASTVLQRSMHELHVEIIWNSMSLAEFSVPWKSRQTGYMFNTVEELSGFNPWPNKKATNDSDRVWEPVVHMCMPGTTMNLGMKDIALAVEFLAHHLLLGFSHIYFTVALKRDSRKFRYLSTYLGTFLREGKISISSSSDDLDGLSTTNGLLWDAVVQKINAATMRLFFAKGFADYLAVLEVDEFLILRHQLASIQDVIKFNDLPPHFKGIAPGSGMNGLIGFSDKQRHPLCYLQVYIEVVGNRYQSVNLSRIFVGEAYPHSSEKLQFSDRAIPLVRVILPTRRIYQGGVRDGAACRLDWMWTTCANESNIEMEFCEKGYGVPDRESSFHRFDEIVGKKKLRTVDPWKHAIIYHFMIHDATVLASNRSLSAANVYSKRFSSHVQFDIQKRGLTYIFER